MRPDTTFIFTVDVSGSMGWDSSEISTRRPGRLSRQLSTPWSIRSPPATRSPWSPTAARSATPLALTSGAERARHPHRHRQPARGRLDRHERRAAPAPTSIGPTGARPGQRQRARWSCSPTCNPTSARTRRARSAIAHRGRRRRRAHHRGRARPRRRAPRSCRAWRRCAAPTPSASRSPTRVGTFMADQYPWFTAPIAYDLAVDGAAQPGPRHRDAYGFPTGFAEDAAASTSPPCSCRRTGRAADVAGRTNDGALDGADADADVSWPNPSGVARSATLRTARDGAVLDERGQWFAQAVDRAHDRAGPAGLRHARRRRRPTAAIPRCGDRDHQAHAPRPASPPTPRRSPTRPSTPRSRWRASCCA